MEIYTDLGAAWEELSSKTEMIVCSFEKCGISVAPDRSEDEKINIIVLEDYSVESDDDDDPFSNEDEGEGEENEDEGVKTLRTEDPYRSGTQDF